MPDDTTAAPHGPVVEVDIVSDVMCPWCVIGFRQLEQALEVTGAGARIRWHPFELNPDMGPEGQNLSDHISQKYGASAEQSAKNRAHVETLGQSHGIVFAFGPESRIVNSFGAHQLLEFALAQGVQHPLKLALFQAYFTQGRDVSDIATLLDIAQSVGLDPAAAERVLDSGTLAANVREKQKFWTDRGISGVPSMVFDGKYLLTGAQGAENYANLLRKVVSEQAA